MDHVCKVCGKTFKSRSGLSDHERRHSGKAPYKCCGQNFYSRTHFIRHRCSFHEMVKKYKCKKCRKEFAVEGDLQRHERREECHGIYKCDTCGNTFHRRGDSIEHLAKHSGKKNFLCNCGKDFRYHSGLSRHRRSCLKSTN